MEQHDYLKKQIDQVGQVLGMIFSGLIGIKGQISDGIEITNQSLKNELDLDIQKLIDTPAYNLINILKTKKEFNNENLEKLADILLIIADNRQGNDKKNLYEKCLTIYEYMEKTENTYSFDRLRKIERIKNVL